MELPYSTAPKYSSHRNRGWLSTAVDDLTTSLLDRRGHPAESSGRSGRSVRVRCMTDEAPA